MTIPALCELFGVNEEQARALDISMNTALRAGAGSGKTRVLTKRFVRCLMDNPDWTLDSIAAITFTRKAATEMKDRVRKELSDRISKISDCSEKKRFFDLKMRISDSNINTIHGFCAGILRDNFADLGIDPKFKIIEEVDKCVILSEIAGKAINRLIEDDSNQQMVKSIAENYSTRFFAGKLKQGILSAFGALREKGIDISEFINKFKTTDEEKDPTRELQKVALKLIKIVANDYTAYKETENLMDFNDIEILSEKLLQNDSVRAGYFNRFKTILVDEFQDVNPLQKKILEKLTLEQGNIPAGRFFIVGDHKQSIYGFRGSDYRVFEQTCNQISTCGKVEILNNCYRSTKNIIQAVNKVFGQLLSPYEELSHPGHVDSNDRKVELITWNKASLKAEKGKSRWESAKNLLDSEGAGEKLERVLKADYSENKSEGKKDYQGDVISTTIQKLKTEDYLYSDVAILLRSRTSLGEIEKSLIRDDIPYCVLGGIGFWDKQEIGDILALYRLVFHPYDKLALFTVLRSPIFGFSDDLLLMLSSSIKKQATGKPCSMMAVFAEGVPDESKPIAERAAKLIAQILPMDGIQNSTELFNHIIAVTGYDEILTALPQGEKKLRNLEKLLDIVEEFEAKGIYSARELLAYLEVLEDSSGMDGEAFLDNEDSNAVKILTIHASKGLEFKAVLIPDLDRPLGYQLKMSKPLFFVDEMQGLTAMGLNKDNNFHESANPKYLKLFEEKIKREMEDSRRLFYVAATRAKEYLGLIGEKQDADEQESINKQNSFMKQLVWAMKKAGSIEQIAEIDAAKIVLKQQNTLKYPVAAIEDMKRLIAESAEDALNQRLQYCERHDEGSISISAWTKFKECPRKFYLENILGVVGKKDLSESAEQAEKSRNMSAADSGLLLHAVLEGVASDVNLSDFQAEIIKAAEDRGVEPSEADMEFLFDAADGFVEIEKTRQKEDTGKLVTSLREYGFRVPLTGKIILTGYIDRVDIFEREGRVYAQIIDYKSSRQKQIHTSGKIADDHKEQMFTYAAALSRMPFYKASKVPVKEAFIYYLNHGKAVNIAIAKENIEETVKNLTDLVPWFIGNKQFKDYQGKKTKNCEWCLCKKYCGS